MYKNLTHKVDIWRIHLIKLSRRGSAQCTGCTREKHRIFLWPGRCPDLMTPGEYRKSRKRRRGGMEQTSGYSLSQGFHRSNCLQSEEGTEQGQILSNNFKLYLKTRLMKTRWNIRSEISGPGAFVQAEKHQAWWVIFNIIIYMRLNKESDRVHGVNVQKSHT